MRRALVALLVAAAVLLPATALAETFRFRAARDSGDFEWRPRRRVIMQGDRIVWKNPSEFTHTVTAWSGDWSKNTTLASGDRTRKRFRRRGVFKFRCIIGDGTEFAHSRLEDGACEGMCGTVRVR